MELTPQAIQDRIARHRTTQATVTVTGPGGRPVANAPVTIRQVRHQFLFGCNAFRIDTANTTAKQAAYQQHFLALLNFATLPFYWGGYEPTEGAPAVEQLTMQARWCAEHGLRTKGHPLCWHQSQPKWLDGKSLEEVQALQIGRIGREVKQFAGLVDTWDVVNEAVRMPDFTVEKNPIPALCQKLGRVGLLKETFAAARRANPRATLLLNDFDTSEKNEQLIVEALAAGVPIDTIGIQSHMHTGYWGAAQQLAVCERFGRFGKPLHLTELTIISGPKKQDQRWFGPPYTDWHSTPEGEAQQAHDLAEFYTAMFSHPAVGAVTWWDFTDDNAWLGAPAGLLDKNLEPKPAYNALMKLIKGDWWTKEVKAVTDAAGQVSFRGFLGDYRVESAAGAGDFTLGVAGECRRAVKVAG